MCLLIKAIPGRQPVPLKVILHVNANEVELTHIQQRIDLLKLFINAVRQDKNSNQEWTNNRSSAIYCPPIN